jgi:chorismate mutase
MSELERLRAEISRVDGELLALVNRRLELVAELKRWKEANGVAFVDPEREAALLDARARENAGPLSEKGLRTFFEQLLALTKRELR